MPYDSNGNWKVTAGESLASISQQVYGDQRMMQALSEYNGGAMMLHTGDVLSLPAKPNKVVVTNNWIAEKANPAALSINPDAQLMNYSTDPEGFKRFASSPDSLTGANAEGGSIPTGQVIPNSSWLQGAGQSPSKSFPIPVTAPIALGNDEWKKRISGTTSVAAPVQNTIAPSPQGQYGRGSLTGASGGPGEGISPARRPGYAPTANKLNMPPIASPTQSGGAAGSAKSFTAPTIGPTPYYGDTATHWGNMGYARYLDYRSALDAAMLDPNKMDDLPTFISREAAQNLQTVLRPDGTVYKLELAGYVQDKVTGTWYRFPAANTGLDALISNYKPYYQNLQPLNDVGGGGGGGGGGSGGGGSQGNLSQGILAFRVSSGGVA